MTFDELLRKALAFALTASVSAGLAHGGAWLTPAPETKDAAQEPEFDSGVAEGPELSDGSPAPTATDVLPTMGYEPCAAEDGPGPCFWDAAVRGNNAGVSFVLLANGERISLAR